MPVSPPRTPTLCQPGSSGTGAVVFPVPSPESMITAEAGAASASRSTSTEVIGASRMRARETITDASGRLRRLVREQLRERRLIEHRDAEIARGGQLAAGLVARHHVARLLRDAAGDLASAGLDLLLRLAAR